MNRQTTTERIIELIIFLVVILIFGAIIAAITIPNHVGSRGNPVNTCINNLRVIDACKQQWAIEHGRTNGLVSWNDITPYLTNLAPATPRVPITQAIHCPSGGTYTLGRIEELPKCTIPKHSLNPAEQ